jgi:hypothetical protein
MFVYSEQARRGYHRSVAPRDEVMRFERYFSGAEKLSAASRTVG